MEKMKNKAYKVFCFVFHAGFNGAGNGAILFETGYFSWVLEGKERVVGPDCKVADRAEFAFPNLAINFVACSEDWGTNQGRKQKHAF